MTLAMLRQTAVRSSRRRPTHLPKAFSSARLAVHHRTPLFCACSSRSLATSSESSSAIRAEKASSQSSTRRSSSLLTTAAVATISLGLGFGLGQSYRSPAQPSSPHVLPSGLPRTCCETEAPALTPAQKELPAKLRKILGQDSLVVDGHQLTSRTLPFLQGARLGQGPALAIARPQTLLQAVQCLEAIVAADCVVLPQGQNTGLTGGSVPRASLDTRPTVVLSMKDLHRLFPIDQGARVVCLPGVGLAQLQEFLAKEFPHRSSHSTLGSTFLNPTTAAGVAFGSGGTQVRKGPAYTERALVAMVRPDKWGTPKVEIVDTLGIAGLEGMDPADGGRPSDSAMAKVDRWSRWIAEGRERVLRNSVDQVPPASDVTYGQRLCQHASSPHKDTVSRCNADTRGPDWNRSEGKVLILATVHDTFPQPQQTKTLWLTFDSLETALAFRRQVCLDNAQDLPISVEYVDRDSCQVIDEAGRWLGQAIAVLGPSSSMVRHLWNVKLWVEGLPFDWAPTICDAALYRLNGLLPALLPRRMYESTTTGDHHVVMTVGDFGQGEMDRIQERLDQFCAQHPVVVHECQSAKEVAQLTAFRFVAAAAFRTYCVGRGLQGVSIDYALPKSTGGAVPPIDEKDAQPVKRMRYSHFGCNVVHEDLAYPANVDVHEAKHALKHTIESACRGRLPAEHGHGTEYKAPADTQARWKRMDPLNVLNPGIGGLSDKPQYKES